jgi:hypothetical protein
MAGIFDPAIFDPAIFDSGSAQPTTACTVAQEQVPQEEQASATLQQAVAIAQSQAAQEQQATAFMTEALAIAEDQAVQEEHADVTTSGGQPTTDVVVAQDQAAQEEAAELTFGAPTIPGIIPSAGQYTYSQESRPQRARAKPSRIPHGLTIPETWPETEPGRPQPVTATTVSQEQAAQDQSAELELGAIWRPYQFTPQPPRSTIGAYRAPARAAGGAPKKAPPARPSRIPQPTRRRTRATTKPAVESDEEAMATAILTLLGGPR